jgi:hypothetical protein
MKRFIILTLIICLCFAPLGCKTTGSGIGAGGGALAGAGAGYLASGGDWKWALIGAAVGAIAGATAGHYIDKYVKGREDSKNEIGYKDSDGEKVQIQNASTTPANVTPGNELKLEVNYYVLNSDTEAKVNVKETRVVTYNGQQMFKPLEREVERDQGLLTSTAKMNIPKDAQKGEYEVTTTLTYGDKSVASVTKFTVS